jgi:RNA polymerase sigma-70 factor (ECF subfamily)
MAAQDKASPESEAALETLCRRYWYPLYAFVRRSGQSAHDAQDLTQEFFARLLQKDWLDAVERDRGRFRSFLLMAMKRFLANEWHRAQTLKRGAGIAFLALDADVAESRYAVETTPATRADSLYERRWAMALLENVMERLRQEHEAAGRLAEYEFLKPCLTAERGDLNYEELAAALRMEAVSARSAVHRVRKRFREIFREEVAGTVANPAEVDDEMRAVIAALARE